MAERILIVDDDVSLRRVLEYNLQEAGYEVLTAADGAEGLALFQSRQPALVITDVKMPGMSGFELLTRIKEASPEALVIVITAFGEVETAVAAMKQGAYDYLVKPFNRDALKLTVAKALAFSGLSTENRQLKAALAAPATSRELVGTSRRVRELLAMVERVAASDASVLVTGESGTGKELVARELHARSPRRQGPFIAVNCAAIPRELLESELFGHRRGAFTGATQDKLGKFQVAAGGTLLLDEVGELPLELQAKLLRVLQEREVEPLGGSQPVKLDFRLVAATNAELQAAIAAGRFREDLYYRLAVVPIHLPPLRERVEDIPELVRYLADRHGGQGVRFSAGVLQRFAAYPWPGNIRQLENLVARLLLLRSGDTVEVGDLPADLAAAAHGRPAGILNLPDDGYPLEALEAEAVRQALQRTGWNQAAAARFLRIPRHTLLYRMEKYGISREEA